MPRHLPAPPHLAVIDVAFISLTLVLPVIRDLLFSEGEIIALIKPQFEVGKGEVGRGGVIRDPRQYAAVIRKVARAAHGLGMAIKGLCASPIMGAKGNREFFIHLARGGGAAADLGNVERWIGETIVSLPPDKLAREA
jgi:23S rRNA (cytidine1920-2'-O)/16S rRNA (cytidine1409-2'-O)-methyltransferase